MNTKITNRGRFIDFTENQLEFLRVFMPEKYQLSRSEVEVFILAVSGYKNIEIAEKLCVAEKTIKFHLGNAYKKLKVKTRVQLWFTLPLRNMFELGLPPKNSFENKIPEKIPEKPPEVAPTILPSGMHQL